MHAFRTQDQTTPRRILEQSGGATMEVAAARACVRHQLRFQFVPSYGQGSFPCSQACLDVLKLFILGPLPFVVPVEGRSKDHGEETGTACQTH